MKGMELSRAYYEAHGRQMLYEGFPGYADKIAAGLVGQGSECFGFDDSLSCDHDYGPGFCLWLTRKDFQAVGPALQSAYDALPREFMGFPARLQSRHGGGRVGVLEADDFYRRQIGCSRVPESLLEWLRIPEFRLATVTNGEVFQDPLGEFSSVRTALLRFYPEDVRVKKIAARAATMAQSGQYNYARSMSRGETVPAILALAEFVKHTMSMVYLLNRKYAPFYKWMHRGMRELSVLAEIYDLVRKLSLAGIHAESWLFGTPGEMATVLNSDDENVVLVERICQLVKERLQLEELTDTDEDFLAPHAERIMMRIKDSSIRELHVMEG